MTVEPYWLRGKIPFWPLFLSKYERFDHVHLIDILKLVVGDAGYRRIILQHSLQRQRILCNDYKPYSERLDHMHDVCMHVYMNVCMYVNLRMVCIWYVCYIHSYIHT